MEQTSIASRKHHEHKKSFHKSPLIVVKRIFQVPLLWVWKAWSDQEMIEFWWGPKGFTSHNAKIDFREGGKYLIDMHAPDGKVIWRTGHCEEIIPCSRMVFSEHFSDEKGTPLAGYKLDMHGDWPKKRYVTVEFEKIGSYQTQMTVSHEGVQKENHEEYIRGWNESFDKLQNIVEQHHPSETEDHLQG